MNSQAAVDALIKLNAGGSVNAGELDAMIGAGFIVIVGDPPYHQVTAAGQAALGQSSSP